MFSTGASGLVNQYVLATLTTYILGNSIEQFSIVIASMMLMMGVSGLVQNKMSDDHLIEKFMAVEVMMALMGGFAPLVIYGAYGYMQNHFELVHYFFVLGIGFLIGFEIPIVMRILEKKNVGLKTNLTIVYAMDYIGAFIGAIIWINYLLKFHPLTEISFIVAGFNFIVAVFAILYFVYTGEIKRRFLAITVLAFTASALVWGFCENRDLSDLFEQRFYDDPIVHRETTKYQHLVLTENTGTGDVRLYINGNTQFSSLDEDRYHDFLVHPVMTLAKKTKHILVLGGGDGLALRELHKYPEIETITLVDLDPDMILLATHNPIMRKLNNNAFDDTRIQTQKPGGIVETNVKPILLKEDSAFDKSANDADWVASVSVFSLDADQFIKNIETQTWDVVVIDFPDPSSIELSKLYSKQFYLKLAKNLKKDAIIAIQSTSPYHAKEAFLTIGNTLRAAGFKALPYRQNVPSFGDWGFYLAWQSEDSPQAMKDKIKALSQFNVNTNFITTELLTASLAFGKGELESNMHCVNSIMQPCLVKQYTDHSWLIE
ncbi:MAG: spermidine synthase [Oleiphilaceae bacterium]|jgi:spermidine synthase